RTPNFKLVQNQKTGMVKLFDLQRDPGERRSLARTRPGVVETLSARLEQWRGSVPRFAARSDEAPALSDERIDELRALGYVD
ncbi:MAG: hypothetical protein AAFX50_23060, partial [Acidobacteriota bacterium]